MSNLEKLQQYTVEKALMSFSGILQIISDGIMKREKIYALSIMVTSSLVLELVILVRKTYRTTSVEELRHLLNETACFERHIYQEREKQNFPYAENGSSLEDKPHK